MKIYRRLRTWLIAIGMSALILLVGILYHNLHNNQVSPDWKQQLIKQNASLQHEITTNKHLPAVEIKNLQVEYKVNQYHIDHTIAPSQTTGWDFVDIIVTRLGTLISVFVAVIAGDIVASEFSWGTIKALLTRPVKRWQILSSKFIATLIFGVFFTALTFLVSYVVGGAFFGFGGADHLQVYLNANQDITQVSTLQYVFMNYGFMAIELLMTLVIAFMISSLFRSSSLAISISIVTLFVGSAVVHFLAAYGWVKYILFANTDLSQYFINGPTISGMTLGFSIVMLVLYFIVMNGLAYFTFGKRDVSVG